MVPLSKSGLRKQRGFESHPLRHVGPHGRTIRALRASGPPSRTSQSARSGPRPAPSARPAPEARDPRYSSSSPSSPSRISGGGAALAERSPSGLWRRTGNAVRGNPSRVRIPPSPPLARIGADGLRLSLVGRARRGTSGALNLQSAPAGLNSLSRSRRSEAAPPGDVEDRVPRSGESRTVSGPEGSSTQRISSGAAERPGLSRLAGWARVPFDRQGVHGTTQGAA
jgi:hypothetical protein